MSVKEKLLQKLEEKEERMIEIRRHLHENPELSFEEENTAKYIADFYDGKDVKVTPELPEGALDRVERVLCGLPRGAAEPALAPEPVPGEQVMSVRAAMLSDRETLPARECLGRILAVPTVGCPPAVPILACGERITAGALRSLQWYGIDTCCVVKE